MPQDDIASEKQRNFLWDLIQGAFLMGMQEHMLPAINSEETATATFQTHLTKRQCSELLDDLIFRVGAVPTRTLEAPRAASAKQIGMWNRLATELADMGDDKWMNHQMEGRYSWTVSQWINKAMREKEYREERAAEASNPSAPPFVPTPPPPPAGDNSGQF